MTKNVKVTDKTGNLIGTTYPKRARGLVKNGRAEYVSDCEIRLLITHASAVLNEINDTEDINMSKVINFNAREFKFDSTCTDNVGSRMFITDADSNVEVFEIGDWNWNWTQIQSIKRLEKNTDYVFRFEIRGGYNSTRDAISKVFIQFDDDWDNRYVYAIEKSLYKPLFSKKNQNGELIRVYEIPFNTGNAETTSIVFVALHAVAMICPSLENEAYANLEDYTYNDLWKNQKPNFDKSNINLSGAVLSEKMLGKLLSKFQYGDIDLSGADIRNSDDEEDYDNNNFGDDSFDECTSFENME